MIYLLYINKNYTDNIIPIDIGIFKDKFVKICIVK